MTGPDSDSAWSWWRDRRRPAELVHLDTAAAGRSSTATLAAAAAHAEREASRGAYVAQAEAAPALDAGRAELAGLLGVPPAGLALWCAKRRRAEFRPAPTGTVARCPGYHRDGGPLSRFHRFPPVPQESR